jgi:hypothetical protein
MRAEMEKMKSSDQNFTSMKENEESLLEFGEEDDDDDDEEPVIDDDDEEGAEDKDIGVGKRKKDDAIQPTEESSQGSLEKGFRVS